MGKHVARQECNAIERNIPGEPMRQRRKRGDGSWARRRGGEPTYCFEQRSCPLSRWMAMGTQRERELSFPKTFSHGLSHCSQPEGSRAKLLGCG